MQIYHFYLSQTTLLKLFSNYQEHLFHCFLRKEFFVDFLCELLNGPQRDFLHNFEIAKFLHLFPCMSVGVRVCVYRVAERSRSGRGMRRDAAGWNDAARCGGMRRDERKTKQTQKTRCKHGEFYDILRKNSAAGCGGMKREKQNRPRKLGVHTVSFTIFRGKTF